MNHTLSVPGFEGQSLDVQIGGIFAAPKLFVNGQPARKGKKRNQMLLRRNDGQNVVARWKNQFVDVPKLVIDDEVINVVEPLRWYHWIWSGLSLILLFVGGALGGVAGVIGLSLNAKIFRSEMNTPLKYALTAAVTVGVGIAYAVLAVLATSLIQTAFS